MNSLSLYQITGMIPTIMEQEEITPELKEQLEKELNNAGFNIKIETEHTYYYLQLI